MSRADGLRLAVGTFTVVPVPAPRVVGRREARAAMLLAPVVGAGLASVAATLLLACYALEADPALAAALAVALLAVLTRGLHLDGLADVADGLGSRRSAQGALEVMHRPEIGALGAVSLVLVLLVQVTALAAAQRTGAGPAAVLLGVLAGRVAIVAACTSGVPAARPDGLGSAVAGSVPRWAAAAWVVVLLAGAGLVGGVTDDLPAATAAIAVAAGLLVGLALLRRCVGRLGGMTGDVLGAACEAATTATLVVLALLR